MAVAVKRCPVADWVKCLCLHDAVCARRGEAWTMKIAECLLKNECQEPDEILGLCLTDLNLAGQR